MRVWGHTLIKNEGRWLWFSVTSVIDYLDKLLIWDTGSSDDTELIINKLIDKYPQKINYKKRLLKSPQDFSKIRQEMLDETDADWFGVIDGDEIWWKDSISKAIESINKNKDFESIVVPTVNLVGDIYHYQEKHSGNYRLAGRVGHYNLRFINRKIPGLSSFGGHGQWGWVDGYGKMIQDRDPKKILFVDAPYIHATNIQRSSVNSGDMEVIKRKNKIKYDLGINFPLDYFYPESLFQERPDFIESPWRTRNSSFVARAVIETPLKKIKRRYWFKRVGY